MQKDTGIDVSIIIVSWNTSDLLKACLESIYNETVSCTFEVFVVDNASQDDSVEIVRQRFPDVNLIASRENLGFPKANNLALKKCKGKNVLFLNPDTLILERAIETMHEYLEHNPGVGAVGPKIYGADNKIQFDGARNFPTLFNVFLEFLRLAKHFPNNRILGRFRMGDWDHKDDRDVNSLDGSCMLIRRDILSRIGFMDEDLFMYLEDMDLCYRIRKNGWIIHYLSAAKIIHLCGQSSKKVDHKSLFYTLELEAYRQFNKKHYSKLHGLLVQVIVFIISLDVLIISLTGSKFQFLTERFPRFFSEIYRDKFINFLHWSLTPDRIAAKAVSR